MKKVARLRVVADEYSNVGAAGDQVGVRTTGRIKKPKAVFDPSDNYLPRSQRSGNATASTPSPSSAAAVGGGIMERKKEPEQSSFQHKRLSQSSCTSFGSSSSLVSPSIPPADACYVCNKKETKRGIGAKNKLIACVDCDMKVHKMCLKIDFEDYDVLRANYRCDNCRTCILCAAFADAEAGIDKEFVTCTKCVKSYHLSCHIPNVHKFQQHQKNWKCNKCSLPINGNASIMAAKTIREIIGDESAAENNATAAMNKTADKPIQQNVNIAAAAEEAKKSAEATKRNSQELKNNTNISSNGNAEAENKIESKRTKGDEPQSSVRYSPNEPIEDVKDWTVDQVHAFFAKYFPNEAYVFKDHEIDGNSLLLLKRSDVIKELPIKLGPSLRIYSLILKLQTQINDSTLGWNCGI